MLRLAVVTLTLAALGGAPSVALADGIPGTNGAPLPKLDWGQCPAATPEEAEFLRPYRCTTARVPLSYRNPRGPSIELALGSSRPRTRRAASARCSGTPAARAARVASRRRSRTRCTSASTSSVRSARDRREHAVEVLREQRGGARACSGRRSRSRASRSARSSACRSRGRAAARATAARSCRTWRRGTSRVTSTCFAGRSATGG